MLTSTEQNQRQGQTSTVRQKVTRGTKDTKPRPGAFGENLQNSDAWSPPPKSGHAVPQDLRRAPNHWSTHGDLVEKTVSTPTGEVVALEQARFRKFDNTLSPYQAQTKLEHLLPKLGELFATADDQFEHEVRQLFFDPQTTYKEFEATVNQRFNERTNPPTHAFLFQESSATL